MNSHKIEIRLIAGDGSWQYVWSAATGVDPHRAVSAARDVVSIAGSAAAGDWPAENVLATLERIGREYPEIEPAIALGPDLGEPVMVADETFEIEAAPGTPTPATVTPKPEPKPTSKQSSKEKK